MSNRQDRIAQLQTTTKQYIAAEQQRIQNEVSVLQAVLQTRTGGAGIQASGTAVVEAVAQRSLSDFLSDS